MSAVEHPRRLSSQVTGRAGAERTRTLRCRYIYMTISNSAAETNLCSIKSALGPSRIASRRSRSQLIAKISFRVTASGRPAPVPVQLVRSALCPRPLSIVGGFCCRSQAATNERRSGQRHGNSFTTFRCRRNGGDRRRHFLTLRE